MEGTPMSETANPHLVHTELFETEAARVAALLATLSAADWERPIPTCPGWTVRKAAKHIGGAHRWAHAIVSSGGPVAPRSIDRGLPAADDGLADWVRDGAATLATGLRATDGAAPSWTWRGDAEVGFWSRRMLHETAVHRGDIELALGRVPEYDRAVAVDGVDEFLENLPHAAPFAPRVRELTGDGETLHLHATDASTDTDAPKCGGDAEWLITLEPQGFRWQRAHAKGAAAVRGPVGDLYLFAWGRRRPDSPEVEVLGDHVLLDHWVQNTML
jgi:uncharacterized protein (TIGR03083 family)